MDPQEFVDAVRSENNTALSRLGSSKALYADTGGEMEDDAVLRAAGDRAHHAADTFEPWADEAGGPPQDLFGQAAAAERERVEVLAGERGDFEPGDPPAVQTHLRAVEGAVARVGAFVGWALAASENNDQLVGYFVGQASPGTASTFREFGDDYDEYLENARGVLSQVCAGESDRESALAAASEAIQADYDDYFETLESLGVNPKPVC